jgi:hypothetical protein
MACQAHEPRRIALTGGPGAGKTAVLEIVRWSMCDHVRVLPESAGIVFGGGFPRATSVEARRAAQRAIFHVQRELEALAAGDAHGIALCDRGTIDGGAYWPGPSDLWPAVGTTLEAELARYHAVIHLRTPRAGYNHDNPLRVESAREASMIDERIAALWAGHPRRFEVPAEADFLTKMSKALQVLRDQLPTCCRAHLPMIEHATGPVPVAQALHRVGA